MLGTQQFDVVIVQRHIRLDTLAVQVTQHLFQSLARLVGSLRDFNTAFRCADPPFGVGSIECQRGWKLWLDPVGNPRGNKFGLVNEFGLGTDFSQQAFVQLV